MREGHTSEFGDYIGSNYSIPYDPYAYYTLNNEQICCLSLFWHASEALLGYLPAIQFDSMSTKSTSNFKVKIQLTFFDQTVYTTPELSFWFSCSQ